MASEVYEASPIKRRRATQDEMEARAKFLIDYAAEHGPVTVRGLYYQAEVSGVPGIDKTDSSYVKVQRQVLNLRRECRLAYCDISDATRWMRKPRSHNSVEDAIAHTARTYRRSLWADAEDYVEIWCEKDALAGVIYPVTAEFDVPLMVARALPQRNSVMRPSPPERAMIATTTSTTSVTSTALAGTLLAPLKRS
jgi:hypothetical protein